MRPGRRDRPARRAREGSEQGRQAGAGRPLEVGVCPLAPLLPSAPLRACFPSLPLSRSHEHGAWPVCGPSCDDGALPACHNQRAAGPSSQQAGGSNEGERGSSCRAQCRLMGRRMTRRLLFRPAFFLTPLPLSPSTAFPAGRGECRPGREAATCRKSKAYVSKCASDRRTLDTFRIIFICLFSNVYKIIASTAQIPLVFFDTKRILQLSNGDTQRFGVRDFPKVI